MPFATNNHHRFLKKKRLFSCWVLLGIWFCSSPKVLAQERFTCQYEQMGTQIGLVFYTSNKAHADSLAQMAFARIDSLNAHLSNYIPHSEINRLSATADRKIQVGKDLYRVLALSQVYSQMTHGAFDVTLGPLIELWRTARSQQQFPDTMALQKAMQHIGHTKMVLFSPDTVVLRQTGMGLDVGGIGKGFAADAVLELLRAQGVGSVLVDMGGDITVGDPPPGKTYWTLGLTYNDAQGKEVFKKIRLKNQAVATSGDLYQHVMLQGKRYSHIIDPRTGLALSNQTQVTVIAPTGAMADAFASGLSVLGIEEAPKLVESIPNLEAYMVMGVPGSYAQWDSKGFEDFILEP